LNIVNLTKNASRVEMLCLINDETFRIWVDTGSPNTLVSSKLINILNLPPIGTRRYSGKVAGVQFRNKPSITIPKIIIPGCLPLKNIRALAALDSDEWNGIVILGLNVLNHLVYKVDRGGGIFEWLESLASSIPGSTRTKFDHVIWNGAYLLSDI